MRRNNAVPPRRERLRVVLDTNVIVGFFTSRTGRADNARVFDAWLVTRQLQLIISPPLVGEYLELLDRIGVEAARVLAFRQRLQTLPTVTRVNLGKRFPVSRDPDDDALLATAHAGRALYLVTNDRDLLEIPDEARQPFRFEIVRPSKLLRALST